MKPVSGFFHDADNNSSKPKEISQPPHFHEKPMTAIEIQANRQQFLDYCRAYIQRDGLENLLNYIEKTDFFCGDKVKDALIFNAVSIKNL